MRIDIYSDTICPWCFIGKRRLEAARALRPEVPVEVHWRPFQLNPEMPRAGIARDTYLALKFGGSQRARQIYDMIREAGEGAGIAFNFTGIGHTPNTLDSHRVIRFAQARGNADSVVENLFRAYFLYQVDIGERERLVEIGASSGLDGNELARHLDSDDDMDAVRSEDLRARRMGIDGVPCFIVNERWAIAGAQEADAFMPLFDLAHQEATAAE